MKLKVFISSLLLFVMAATGKAAAGTETVAVLNFSIPATTSNRWEWAAGGIPDLLQLELQSSGLNLLDRDLIHAVISEERLAAGGRTSKDSFQLAKLLNAQFLISGKIVPLEGRRFRVEADAFSVEAVEAAVTVFADGDFPDDLAAVVKNVAEQLAKKLRAADAPAVVAPGNRFAPKPESLILFYHGLNACAGGQPERGAACFINAAALDGSFSAPLLWEIKAYEMAGLYQHAALRREETSEALKKLGVEMSRSNNPAADNFKPVLAVLNPVVTGLDESFKPLALGAALGQGLLDTRRVRLFAFDKIGGAVAEQDLRLSSFFSSQSAPRYGRWLAVDGLVICRASPAKAGQLRLDLALVNPLTGVTMTRLERTGLVGAWSELVRDTAAELLAQWTNHSATVPQPPVAGESSAATMEAGAFELRPVFQNLVNAMKQVRREGEKSDSHRALADAFAAAGRPKLAALEIERCLRALDIRATNAAGIFFGTHRWLFWEVSPASGAVGLVDQKLIESMIAQLLETYPDSLCAGCMHYNLAVTEWRAEHWAAAASHALSARQIIKPPPDHAEMDLEVLAATFFLEGASLNQQGKSAEAKTVLHHGLEFMRSRHVRDFCLPLGPYTGNFFGPEHIYGYGGDRPGIKTRLEAELAKLGETIIHPPQPEMPPMVAAKEPGADWIQRGQLEFQKGNYQPALECYQKAVAQGAPVMACPGLAFALLEVALEKNLGHPADEIERLRLQLGLPPIQASWVEWFGTGRKYQTGHQFDLEKAVACYRGAMDFMEHPEQRGIYRLEKEPGCDRTNLWWGKDIGAAELRWTEKYDERWYSAAFYLADCLIKLDQKEAAAPWLRQIAIKVGGDSGVPLLEQDTWNSASWSSDNLGVRSAELLQDLHVPKKRVAIGLMDGPYKLPPQLSRAKPLSAPPLPVVDATLLSPLTNALADAGKTRLIQERKERLQPVIAEYGHRLVPVVISFLYQDNCPWDKNLLVQLLDQTADTNDAPWVVNAITREYDLIKTAQRLDPKKTTLVLAQEWQRQEANNFISPGLIRGIVNGRARAFFPLVLDQIAEVKVNHWSDVFLMDGIMAEEQSKELEAAFCEALAQCLKLKLLQQQHYELGRIARVALKYGVSEGIDGLLVSEAASPEKLRSALGNYLVLPKNDSELVSFLNQTHGLWQWNPELRKFELPKNKNSVTR